MSVNFEHSIALVFIGAGAIFLLNSGHSEAGIALLGALGGYAFKNGIIKQPEQPK